MSCKALRHLLPLIVIGVLTPSTVLFAEQGLSHVRVVRLSYVSGTVALRRPASTEWAKAQVNTPIQEGFELSTSANSYAEVEFENGSTARFGELSKVTFDQLAMDADGNKLNRLTLEQGYATFHFLPEHQDAYSVKIAESTLTPKGKSEFRTDLGSHHARVEVFSGSVELAASSRTVKLGKDKVLEFDPDATEVALNTKSGIVKDSWDNWTSQRDTQSQLALNDQAVSPQGPLYGWSDLDAYGEWGFFPGFGYGWSPFASMGWSPFSMGMWSWYPGMGYTWIGGEPWGWLPYHYGNWNYSPGFGYFWMPGEMGAFSPAMVSWYSGPGWIGWSPLGMMAAGGQRIVTTVPGATVQNGLLINPQSVNHVAATAGTPITRLPFEPGAGALLPGPRLAAGVETLGPPGAQTTHNLAPPSVLMGGSPEKEQSLQGGRSRHEPLRVRLGTTLGGQYAVGGSLGEFRGGAFSGSHGPEFSPRSGPNAPTLLPHGQQSTNSPHGGASAPMTSGGGGIGNSAPATMAPPSSGHAAGGGTSGGHH
jgi:hypothetical protein